MYQDQEQPLMDSTTLKDEIEESLNQVEAQIITLEKAQNGNKVAGTEQIISSSCRKLQSIISKVKDLATVIHPNTTLHNFVLKAQEKCKALDNRLQSVSKLLTVQLKQSYTEYKESPPEEVKTNMHPEQRQATVVQLKDAKYMGRILEERQRDLDLIESILLDVHKITMDMNIMVVEQGARIDNVAEEIKSAKDTIHKLSLIHI